MTIHYEKFKTGFYSICSGNGRHFTWMLSEVNCGHCLNRLKKYKAMYKIKLLYTEDGKLLWSRFFPEVPEVQASIYRDTMLMNNYNRQMKEAVRKAIPVENPDKAFEKIVYQERLERDKVYEIECDYEVHYNNGYSIQIL